MLHHVCREIRCDTHFHCVYPAFPTTLHNTSGFFSSEVTGCNNVCNSSAQVFSLLLSEAVIQSQEVPIVVPARLKNSNQHHEAEEAQTEQKDVSTCIRCLLCMTLISPNYPSDVNSYRYTENFRHSQILDWRKGAQIETQCPGHTHGNWNLMGGLDHPESWRGKENTQNIV